MVTLSSLKGTGCSLFRDVLFTLWGRTVRSLGTGCSLQVDGLFALWGRAVRSLGTDCSSMGTGCSLQGGGLFALEGERAIQSIIRRTSSDRQACNIKSIKKVPKCAIFGLLVYKLINPICAGDFWGIFEGRG